jgi:hypothetical protein
LHPLENANPWLTIQIPDVLAEVALMLVWAWLTDGWGIWAPKADPLLFLPVRDERVHGKQQKRSKNIDDALKVRYFSISPPKADLD